MSRPRRTVYVKGDVVYLRDATHALYGQPARVATVRHTPFGSRLWSYDVAFEDATVVEGLGFDDITWKAPAL